MSVPPRPSPSERLDLAVCLNAYSGYPLSTALEQVREALKWSAVELDTIEGLFCHIDLEKVRVRPYRRALVSLFAGAGVECRAVSAQRPAVDRLDAPGLARMASLFELTRELGADRIILGAGTDSDGFRMGIEPLLSVAETLDLKIGLETQGPRQLVHDASCVDLVRSVASDRLDVNYDFGNAFFAVDGELDMLADFKQMQDLVGHAHFKDAVPDPAEGWALAPISGGIVNYRALLALIRGRPIPVSIELPRRMILSSGTRRESVPPLDGINADLLESIQNVLTFWDVSAADGS